MKTNDLITIRKILDENFNHIIMFNKDGTSRAMVYCKGYITSLRCKLYRDYAEKNDGIYWLLQGASVIKAEYTRQDMIEDRLFEEAISIYDGETYYILDMSKAPESYELVKVKANVKGNYSDACVFEEID